MNMQNAQHRPSVTFAGMPVTLPESAVTFTGIRTTHSFQTLMKDLETIVCNTCRTPKSAGAAPSFEITTTPSDKQKRALELIGQIKM